MTVQLDAQAPLQCAICKSHGKITKLMAYGDLEWFRCQSCRVGFQFPYISELDRRQSGIQSTYTSYLDLEQVFAAVAEEKAAWISTACTNDYWVVEIGPGAGALASVMVANGRNYVAVEPNPTFANNLRSKGIITYSGDDPTEALANALQKVANEGARAVIVMDNVLEHVPHPIEFISNLRTLAPSGSLLAIEVPNEFGIRWRALAQDLIRGERKPPTFPGHINLFTKASLHTVLEQAGALPATVTYKGVRSLAEVSYLSQSTHFTLQTRVAVSLLRAVPLDYMLGMPYWLRAFATL